MRVKGTSIRSRLEFLQQRYGDEAGESVLAGLDADDRAAVEKTLAASWVPFALLNRLDAAIVGGPGGQDQQVARDIGVFSAERNLSTVYRMFVDQAGGDPAALLEGLATLHSNFYDWGAMRVVRLGPGECRVEVDYEGAASRTNCLTAVGFYSEALRRLGVEDAAVRETSCQAEGAELCTYEVRWRG